MNVFAACKVGSIACGMLAGGLGVVGAIPELKEALDDLKTPDIVDVTGMTDEEKEALKASGKVIQENF